MHIVCSALRGSIRTLEDVNAGWLTRGECLDFARDALFFRDGLGSGTHSRRFRMERPRLEQLLHDPWVASGDGHSAEPRKSRVGTGFMGGFRIPCG